MSCNTFGNTPIEEITGVIEDCYLVLANADGDILATFPLCGVKINPLSDSVQLCPGGIIPNAVMEQIGFTNEELFESIKECKNPPVVIDGEIDVQKFDASTLTVCNTETNEVCEVLACLDDEVWTYKEPFGGVLSEAEFQAKYTKSFVAYTELPVVTWYLNTDIKKETPIQVIPRRNNKTEIIEYYDCLDTEFINELNIKDYMSNIQGQPIPENLAALTESACIDICLAPTDSLTEADILALFVADGVLLPDGTAPTGFVNASVAVKYAGQQAKDALGAKKKLVSGFCIEVNGDVVNSGSTYCDPKEGLIDNDCDKFVQGEAITLENTGTTDGAVRICVELAPVDANDTDPGVQ